jgi:predicted MFS family arabinose efflux permease
MYLEQGLIVSPEVFDISEIASVRSYVIAAEIFGNGCGGPLGGLVTDHIGWRW